MEDVFNAAVIGRAVTRLIFIVRVLFVLWILWNIFKEERQFFISMVAAAVASCIVAPTIYLALFHVWIVGSIYAAGLPIGGAIAAVIGRGVALVILPTLFLLWIIRIIFIRERQFLINVMAAAVISNIVALTIYLILFLLWIVWNIFRRNRQLQADRKIAGVIGKAVAPMTFLVLFLLWVIWITSKRKTQSLISIAVAGVISSIVAIQNFVLLFLLWTKWNKSDIRWRVLSAASLSSLRHRGILYGTPRALCPSSWVRSEPSVGALRQHVSPFEVEYGPNPFIYTLRDWLASAPLRSMPNIDSTQSASKTLDSETPEEEMSSHMCSTASTSTSHIPSGIQHPTNSHLRSSNPQVLIRDATQEVGPPPKENFSKHYVKPSPTKMPGFGELRNKSLATSLKNSPTTELDAKLPDEASNSQEPSHAVDSNTNISTCNSGKYQCPNICCGQTFAKAYLRKYALRLFARLVIHTDMLKADWGSPKSGNQIISSSRDHKKYSHNVDAKPGGKLDWNEGGRPRQRKHNEAIDPDNKQVEDGNKESAECARDTEWAGQQSL